MRNARLVITAFVAALAEWLRERLTRQPDTMSAENYRKRKARSAQRDREEATEGREIGPLPSVKNRRRRNRCKFDLLRYLRTYHAESFPLEFSADHLDFIAAVQEAVLHGGARAQAMPRGSGKTTIILCAICWAIAYGHRRFIVLCAAEQEAANELADDFRIVWETNDRLAEDFPEIAHPIRQLEGVVQRAKTQLLDGQLTHMRWSGSKLVMPSVPGSAASGSVIRARGLLARIRGMKHTDTAGNTIRPDLVLVEDFQTDESAASETQCAKREKKIAAGILGLAGPGKTMAAFATCTVIRWGDAADRILNRALYPRWRGRRCKLVNEWPTDYQNGGGLWAKYLEIRDGELEDDEATAHPKATAFYKAHRRAMDAGADVPWKARKFPHELSHVEHAVNLRHDNPDSFDSEYQNEPKDDAADASNLRILSSDEFCTLDGPPRGTVPDWAQTVTCGWDVQKDVLFWVVAAVGGDAFDGVVIDYGTWPKQPTGYFSVDEIDNTIEAATGLKGKAALAAALWSLELHLLAKEYRDDAGNTWRLERGLTDAGYETATVYGWARNTSAPLLPCMGVGVTAKQKPWTDTKKRKGERIGFGWRMPSVARTNAARRVDIDTNTWKTDLLQRFALPAGSPGRWTLFRRHAIGHRLFADQMAAEYPTETEGHGRRLYEWTLRPGRENHFLDAALYAAVAANLEGVRHPDEPHAERNRRRRRGVPKNANAAGRRCRQREPDCKDTGHRETDLGDARETRKRTRERKTLGELYAEKKRARATYDD